MDYLDEKLMLLELYRAKRFGNEQVVTTQLSAKVTRSKRSYDYRKHCLICEQELDFALESKRPDVTANQISTNNWIDVATKKYASFARH